MCQTILNVGQRKCRTAVTPVRCTQYGKQRLVLCDGQQLPVCSCIMSGHKITRKGCELTEHAFGIGATGNTQDKYWYQFSV